jgi:murein DD-endopeptidase MepM/ murein hydrolase activator NlpD
MRSIAVKVGDVVDYRDKIGTVGSSGRSTGPHVHFEVVVDGKPHDPMLFVKAGRYVFKG